MSSGFAHADFPGMAWHGTRKLAVEGLGFAERASFFDRFPARAREIVRPDVWHRSQYTAGVSVRFLTNASTVAARWRLRFEREILTHMASTGACGLDLYVRDGRDWFWIGLGVPRSTAETVCRIVDLKWESAAEPREYQLYLPIFNGVDVLEIGLPADATLAAGPPRAQSRLKPLCFYGTSIVHGACASRPGMTYPAILGRRFDRPVLNFGFSGHA